MASPKSIEQKIERISNAWRTLAPDKTFGGMTLAQFETAAAPSLTKRQLIASLNSQLADATAERDQADDALMGKIKQVVAGVLADPTEGPDSALYQEMGYTRESARQSGLHRGKRTEQPKQ